MRNGTRRVRATGSGRRKVMQAWFLAPILISFALVSSGKTRLRIAAGDLTSGNLKGYSPGQGPRILIQELNVGGGSETLARQSGNVRHSIGVANDHLHRSDGRGGWPNSRMGRTQRIATT